MKAMTAFWFLLILGSLLDRGEAVTCIQYVVTSGTLIYSDNFPSNYDNYGTKCWRFTARSFTDLVMVRFQDFQTESIADDVSIYSALYTYSSSVSSFTRIETLSGLYSVYEGYTVTSTGRDMTIVFDPDYSVTYQGFQACVCAASYTTCSCNYRSDSTSSSSSSSGIPGAVIAGIVIGVLLFISIPIIIAIACCCCCQTATTQSNNTVAARRARGELGGTQNARPGHPDRKHNQITPGTYPTGPSGAAAVPPPYTGYSQPPSYGQGQSGVIMTPSTLPQQQQGPTGGTLPPPAGPTAAAAGPNPGVYPPPGQSAYPPPNDAAYPPPPPAATYAPPPGTTGPN